MNKLRAPAIAATAVAATCLLTIAPAQATAAADCGITTLATDTRAASFDRLADKADAAGAKLAVGKFVDALQKLTDYDSALEALHTAPKPKIDADVYATLNAEVESSIACVTIAANT